MPPGIGYPEYRPRSGGSLSDLIMERGRIQSEASLRSGDIWGQTFANVGQTLAGGIQQHAAEKQIKKRDAAWVNFVSDGSWAKDPKAAFAQTVRIWGPEEGPKQFQALVGVSQLAQPKRDQAADMKALGAVGGAMSKLSDPARERLWPQAVVLTKSAFPEIQLPEKYDPAVWAEIEPVISQLAGGKPQGESFTLSPGQQRFGPDGKPLASVPEAPKEAKKYAVTVPGPGGVPVQRLATEEEMAAGVQAYREPRAAPAPEPLVAIMGPDNEPVLVPRSQAAGKRPASNREQGRPVTSGDAGRVAELTTSLDDLKVLGDSISGSGATGVRAKIGAGLPDVVTEMTGLGSGAKSKQATIDRVKQVIGKALEGGVLRKEDEAKYAKILPTIGDPPSVVKSKLKGLEEAIKLRRERLVESLGDAGYDTAAFQGKRPRGSAPVKGGLAPEDSDLLKKYGY